MTTFSSIIYMLKSHKKLEPILADFRQEAGYALAGFQSIVGQKTGRQTITGNHIHTYG